MRIDREVWIPEEDEVLRREALAGRPVAEIAVKAGRTESAVRTRAYIPRIVLRATKVETSLNDDRISLTGGFTPAAVGGIIKHARPHTPPYP
jgi:hypothetical protein